MAKHSSGDIRKIGILGAGFCLGALFNPAAGLTLMATLAICDAAYTSATEFNDVSQPPTNQRGNLQNRLN